MTPHGIAYWTPEEGYWTGTFVDATHPEAYELCEQTARALAAPKPLPPGEIRQVRFVEVEEREVRLSKAVWVMSVGL